jgi:serpin B
LNALAVALAGRSGWVNAPNEDPPVAREITLRSVNAAFGQAGYALETAYLDTLAAQLGAGLRLVDFRADADASRRQINAWVADRTEQRIKELLAGPSVSDATRLVLVNAVYLKAPWASPFDPADTAKAPFTRADGTKVTVPFMHLVSSGLGPMMPAATGKGWAAVRLPYLGNQLAMTVIVPDDLEAFEKTLTAARLAELTQVSYEGSQEGTLEDQKVDLSMPRFSLASDMSLGETLAAMGMPTAFDPTSADFTGIASPDRTGEPGLHIAKVIHQANIDVDEKGTEAAAATAVSMATGGPGDESKPIVIRADRPFLFVLTDVPSGTVLFLGRVADPAAD